MKKFVTWIVMSFVVAVCLMVGLHWVTYKKVQKGIVKIENLTERQKITSDLMLEMERYRRLNGGFRKLTDREIVQIKDSLKDKIVKGVSKLDGLESTEEEKALGKKVSDLTTELFLLSAKLEPQLFTRDVYQKEPIREIHTQIINALNSIRTKSEERTKLVEPETVQLADQSLRGLAGLAVFALLMITLVLARQYMVYLRPTRQIAKRIADIKDGKVVHEGDVVLKGFYGEVESTLNDLAATVEAQRKDRHQFLTAVASDLRSPLVSLQAGANMIGERLDSAQRVQVAEAIKRSLFRLTKTLDDLTDIIDIDRTDIRLDESIVDLGDLIERVCGMLGGPETLHPVTAAVNHEPVWTLIDGKRFERVLISLASKLMLHRPQGGKIEISMSKPTSGPFRGIEIYVQDGGRNDLIFGKASGPEQDILKHWIRENGFGMTLAHKIIKAHNGSITAAGVAGTGIQFTIRIPEDRVANSGLTSGFSNAGAFERTRNKAMLADQNQGLHGIRV